MSKPRLLERVRNSIRVRQYSISTERAYVGWIRRFILFHGKRHPADMQKTEIEDFLSYLAAKRQVSPATQNQALQALLFLYRHVLEIELPKLPAFGFFMIATLPCQWMHHSPNANELCLRSLRVYYL